MCKALSEHHVEVWHLLIDPDSATFRFRSDQSDQHALACVCCCLALAASMSLIWDVRSASGDHLHLDAINQAYKAAQITWIVFW